MAMTRSNDASEIRVSTGNRVGHGFRGMRWAIVGGLLGMVGVIWGIATQDTGGGMVHDLTQGIRDRVADARASVRNQGLASQIEGRIRQDKNLIADKIEVVVEDGSTAILKGEVPDQDDKDKAVTLARDTRGVLKVIDQLALPPTPRVIEAAPAADAPDVATRARSFQ